MTINKVRSKPKNVETGSRQLETKICLINSSYIYYNCMVKLAVKTNLQI